MRTSSRSAFLLLRHPADLAPDRSELPAYLSHVRRRSATRDGDTLQGIWVDEDGVANLPEALVLPDGAGGQRIVRVIEAAGINGVWMVCWLDAPAASVSRVDLMEALLECFGHDDSSASCRARFVPVFYADTPDHHIKAELQRLRTRYPGIVLAPILQDRSGRLVGRSASAPREGAEA
jgi:hypothetical protein